MKANHVRKVRREIAVLTVLTLLILLPLLIWSYVLPQRYPKPWRTLKNNSNISSIAFSPTGTTMASTGKVIYFNDWRTGDLLRTSSLPATAPTVPPSYNFPASVAYNPDGKSLACGHMDATIRIWDAVTGGLLKTLKGHSETPSVAYSPDGKTLASGSWSKKLTYGEIKLWDTTTGKLKRTLPRQKSFVAEVCFSPDGHSLISTGGDDTLKVWNVATGELKQTLRGLGQGLALAFSPDGRYLAAGGWNKVVKLWDARNYRLVREWPFEDAEVRSIAFSPDSRSIAIAASHTKVTVWDVATGDLEHTFAGHKFLVKAVAFSPDGKLLASSGMDRTLYLWRVPGR